MILGEATLSQALKELKIAQDGKILLENARPLFKVHD
jgi:hypothetical protein